MSFCKKVETPNGKPGLEVIVSPNLNHRLERKAFEQIITNCGKVIYGNLEKDEIVRIVAEFDSEEMRDKVFFKVIQSFCRKFETSNGKPGIQVIISSDFNDELEGKVFERILSNDGKVIYARVHSDKTVRLVAEFNSVKVRNKTYKVIMRVLSNCQ